MVGLRTPGSGSQVQESNGSGSGASRTRGPRISDDRGQSEVLGVVLLIAITITGTGLVVALGSNALSDSQEASEIDSAEHAMTQLDSKVSLVGIGAARTQSTSLGVDGGTRVENGSGWMRVVVNPTEPGEPETTVMNQTLGAVIYENGDTEIAYQGGGVWKYTDGGSTMVSPPEVHYRETTLTLPLVVVAGQGPLDGTTLVRQNGTGDPKYPNASAGYRNPLTNAKVNLTVQSRYYEAWGRFFRQRTGGDVEFDHDDRTVTLTLVTPPNVPEVEQGVASTSSQKLVIQGGGGSDTFTNSYNSSEGDYDATQSQAGTVKTVGGVSMSGDAEIRGDLVSGGGEIELASANTRVGGNVSYAGSTDFHKQATIDGWVAANASVAEIDPVGGMVTSKNETIHGDNDNDDVGAISDNRLTGCDSTCELTNGSYYLEEIDLDGGDELVLNLSEGSIGLAVSGPISVDDAKLRVENPDESMVNIYMDATTFEVVNKGNVSVPNEKSGSFRVYGPPGVDADFSDSRFVGMLYAPDSDSQQGTISVTTQAEVFGALVGGQTTLQSGGVVHYDAGLAHSTTLPEDYETAPHVTYMHVTVNRVNVTSY